MNKPKMKQFLLFVLVLSVFGCKKDPFDSRTKYLGDYNFSVTKTTAMSTDTPVDTTYSYLGTIKTGSENNTVIIHFSDDLSVEMNLFEDGSLENYYNFGYYLVGEFESAEKVKFVYSVIGGSRYGVTGGKK